MMPGTTEAALAKPGLPGHHRMLAPPRFAIAERIGEMFDVAVERGLRDRLAHRDLAQRVGISEVGQNGIVHRGASDRHQRIGRERGEIFPIQRSLARQCSEIDGISPAEIVDRKERSAGGNERIQAKRKS